MRLKIAVSIITLSIIATTLTQASIQNNTAEVKPGTYCDASKAENYQAMTTVELQVEVEKHSKNDCLPFALGKELIHRWTKR